MAMLIGQASFAAGEEFAGNPGKNRPAHSARRDEASAFARATSDASLASNCFLPAFADKEEVGVRARVTRR